MSTPSKLGLFGALTLLVVAACAPATDEEPDGSEDNLTEGANKGSRVPEAQVVKFVRSAGFPEKIVGTMVCTAKYESSFFDRAVHTNTNKTIDRGLFQINSIHIGGTKGCPSTAEALWDPATNTKCAFAIYSQGQKKNPDEPRTGVNAWYGYRAHKAECDKYKVPGATGDDNDDDTNANKDADGGTEPPTTTPKPGGKPCYAGTLRADLESGGCYQRESDETWFQCFEGQFYRGVTDGTGPHGKCTSEHPLP